MLMLNSLLLDAFLVAYAVLLVFSLRFAEKGEIVPSYLSVENATSLRGFMAIGIVLHHLSEHVHSGYLFPLMVHAGYLFVCTFFFLSGYGLIVQYLKRGKAYLRGFLRSRLVYLVIIYLLDVLLYSLFDYILGKPHSVLEILRSVYMGGIARNAWYMIALIVFYLCFWLVFRFLPKLSIQTKILLMLLCQVLFIGACLLIGHSGIWYISNFGLSLGMLWAYRKGRVDSAAGKHYWLILSVAILGFILLSAIPVVLEHYSPLEAYHNVPRAICRLLSAPLSSAVLILLLMKARFTGRIWAFLGKISLEIYLLHGMVYTFFRSNIIHLDHDGLWALCTIVVSVMIAFPIHFLNRAIAGLCRRERKKHTEKA